MERARSSPCVRAKAAPKQRREKVVKGGNSNASNESDPRNTRRCAVMVLVKPQIAICIICNSNNQNDEKRIGRTVWGRKIS